MGIIQIDGIGAINWAWSLGGVGTPLVLLHPVGLDLTWWDPQFERFAPDREVIAFDMPGHGRSETPARPPSFDVMADVLEAVLTEIGSRRVHLVGLSVGGMIAQTLTLRRPDLVASLTLVATLCTFPEDVRAVIRERARVARSEGMATIAHLSNERWFTAPFRSARPDVLDRVEKSLTLQSAEFHASMWDMISTLDLEERLTEITCPTLIVTGSEDINAPAGAAQRIASRIAGARLEVLAGLGHFPPFEDPDGFNALLAGFISGVEETFSSAPAA